MATDLKQIPCTTDDVIALQAKLMPEWSAVLKAWTTVTRDLKYRRFNHAETSPYSRWQPLPILKTRGQSEISWAGIHQTYMPMSATCIQFPTLRYLPIIFADFTLVLFKAFSNEMI